jgi:hypothetical protein
MMFRRRLFWGLYALALFIFLVFFFGQYLLYFAETQGGDRLSFGGVTVPKVLVLNKLRAGLKLDATGQMYLNLFSYQASMVMAVLALAGSILVGNDVRYGSVPFYLSKPLAARHYLIGKCLAVAVFVNLMTTLPALFLYFQYQLLDTYGSTASSSLLPGVLAYGLLLSAVLSLLLVATAVAVRRTVPLIMTWTTLFFFFRRLARALVDQMSFDARWKLIDLWNDLYLVGSACLDVPTYKLGRQPEVADAALILGGVSLLCLTYLIRRIRAVEVVS